MKSGRRYIEKTPSSDAPAMVQVKSLQPVFRAMVSHPGRPHQVAWAGWSRTIAASFTGRLMSAPNTPSAIVMYQTTS